ncbi:MAG: hypothetical protein GVY24_06230, partial [Planctomycetes bacterium]|nr:hypothetical protein [Planctomycetota bacterium]
MVGCSGGMTQIDPPEIDLPQDEDPPDTSIMTDMQREYDPPPTDWIERPVSTDCPACEDDVFDAKMRQDNAAALVEQLAHVDEAESPQGARQQLWRSIWVNKRGFDEAIQALRVCEAEHCPQEAGTESRDAAQVAYNSPRFTGFGVGADLPSGGAGSAGGATGSDNSVFPGTGNPIPRA